MRHTPMVFVGARLLASGRLQTTERIPQLWGELLWLASGWGGCGTQAAGPL